MDRSNAFSGSFLRDKCAGAYKELDKEAFPARFDWQSSKQAGLSQLKSNWAGNSGFLKTSYLYKREERHRRFF